MNKQIIHVTLPVCITILVVGAWWVNAGDLNPPAGAVSPTMKNLSDVEPRTAIRNDFVTITPVVISSNGSYYLAEDIMGLSGQNGIEITASNVTLDLRGFEVYGNLEVGTATGILLSPGVSNVTISNGTVRDFSDDGIRGTTGTDITIEKIRVINNGLDGTGDGIELGESSLVVDCIAASNSTRGIMIASGTVTGSIARDNGNDGYWVTNGTIANCSANANLAAGIYGLYATVSQCYATNNTEAGIQLHAGVASQCTTRNNTGDGFHLSWGSSATDCTSSLNGIAGYQAAHSLISDCTADRNTSHAIEVDDRCTVTNNQCYGEPGLTPNGIHATGGGNRIDSNNLSGFNWGIKLLTGGNIAVRNTTYDCTFSLGTTGTNNTGQFVAPGFSFSEPNAWANFFQ